MTARPDGRPERQERGGHLGRRRGFAARAARRGRRCFFASPARRQLDVAEGAARGVRDPVQLHEQRGDVVVARHRLAEHDQVLVVDREVLARFFGLRHFRFVLGQRGFQLLHLRAQLLGFVALRAEEEDPEGGGQRPDEEHRRDQPAG
jgi:hypothetical protein